MLSLVIVASAGWRAAADTVSRAAVSPLELQALVTSAVRQRRRRIRRSITVAPVVLGDTKQYPAALFLVIRWGCSLPAALLADGRRLPAAAARSTLLAVSRNEPTANAADSKRRWLSVRGPARSASLVVIPSGGRSPEARN